MKDKPIITCKKCGQKHYLTPDGKGHIMPVFCCGDELNKASAKKTSGAAATKTTKKKK
ncbi:MAG: hypothetical protein ACYC69_10170 [Thermodesulfovibrionales bacterium]